LKREEGKEKPEVAEPSRHLLTCSSINDSGKDLEQMGHTFMS